MGKLSIIGLVLAVCAAGLLIVKRPSMPIPSDTQSAARLNPGPLAVAVSEFTLTDNSRPTEPNQDFAGAAIRELAIKMWQPQQNEEDPKLNPPYPLLVFSHGLAGSRNNATYLGEFLASHGYILVAMDFPLTKLFAPGGPNVLDMVNQPADITFIIDALLAANEQPSHALYHQIDATRIGLIGHSLGGMTTTLATYHPRLRDPRVSAAISLAGPLEMFGRQLFAAHNTPFMLIASDTDPMVDYNKNAAVLASRINNAMLVTLHNASHSGFTAEGTYLSLLDNPDSIGCWTVADTVNEATPTQDMPLYKLFGSEDEGFLRVPPGKICQQALGTAMPVKRQHELTLLAVHAFLEATLRAPKPLAGKHWDYLTTTLPAEIADVKIQLSQERVSKPHPK